MKLKTSPKLLLPAVGLWSIPLGLLASLQYITNAQFKTITTLILFPLTIAFMSRHARFWVSRSSLGFAGLFAVIVMTFLMTNQKNKDALKDPNSNKTRSALLYLLLVGSFLTGMALTGMFVEPLYNPKNFMPNNNAKPSNTGVEMGNSNASKQIFG